MLRLSRLVTPLLLGAFRLNQTKETLTKLGRQCLGVPPNTHLHHGRDREAGARGRGGGVGFRLSILAAMVFRLLPQTGGQRFQDEHRRIPADQTERRCGQRGMAANPPRHLRSEQIAAETCLEIGLRAGRARLSEGLLNLRRGQAS